VALAAMTAIVIWCPADWGDRDARAAAIADAALASRPLSADLRCGGRAHCRAYCRMGRNLRHWPFWRHRTFNRRSYHPSRRLGVATVLEIARAFTTLPKSPRRSILFLFVTGEEDGLLGSDYFAHNPTVNAHDIVADINVDSAPGIRYPCKDLTPIGARAFEFGFQRRASGATGGLRTHARSDA